MLTPLTGLAMLATAVGSDIRQVRAAWSGQARLSPCIWTG